jgi:3' exoribonuclease, RNase T-like
VLIFIDTEFTDFQNPELISIGLVTEDGQHEFYAELPVDYGKCNDFVLAIVLPQLSRGPGVQRDTEELKIGLKSWIAQFSYKAPITICYDYDGDWTLFCKAIGNDLPIWLSGQNIYPYVDQTALQMFFIENRMNDHHALNDAKANRHAYDSMAEKRDVMRFKKSR